MSYRPENWKNPHKRDNYLGRPDTMKHIAFEAGVDAMLEALKENAITRCDSKNVVISTSKLHFCKPLGIGWLVFIPEEEKNESKN